jgi:hypothetical protein
MPPSVAQYQAVADKVTSGAHTMQAKVPELTAATNDMLGKWYIPGFVKDAVKWIVEGIINIAEKVWNFILEVLKGIAAPVYIAQYAWGWEDVKGTASKVAGELTPGVVGCPDWKGDTATKYTAAIGPQNTASAKVQGVADGTAIALMACFATALAFYIAIGVIIALFIAQLVAAIIAVGSIIFSWAGLAMVAEDCAVSGAMITAAVVTVLTALGAQVGSMITLHGQSVDNSAFPGGHWPKAVLT